ncbi:MAG: alpha/beta hydrolase, partial [Nitrospinae bacterium]|nr:alpha/beta hydrolase [Nitrospinota bacterium]
RGAGHNDTYIAGGEAYFATLDRFIARTLGRINKVNPNKN